MLLIRGSVTLTAAAAATAASAVVTTERYRISDLSLFSLSETFDGGTYVYESLQVMHVQDADPDVYNVYYSHHSIDFFAGQVRSSSSGFVDPTSVTVDGGLGGTHVVATVPVTNYVTAEITLMPLDVTFTAVGPRQHRATTYTTSIPGVHRTTYKSSGVTRTATVSGTLQSDNASISHTKTGSFAITHL